MAKKNKSLPQSLEDAIRLWPQNNCRISLQDIYSALPATKCARAGACCGLLPPVQPVEMLAWLGELCQGDVDTACDMAKGLMHHFLLNAARRLPCPWAREDSCARYEGRFFGCRAYGLWSAGAYEPRRKLSLQAAQQVQQAWKSMGVNLAAAVCAPPPPYCNRVEPVSGPAIDDAGLDSLESELASLGNDQTWHGLLSQCGGDLSYLVAGLALGWNECLQAKVAVTRALLAGDDQQAETQLRQAEQATQSWVGKILNQSA
jgi:hypothetical protein